MTDRMLAQLAGGEWLRRLPAYLYVVDLIAKKRVLEVGCGTGIGAEFLANHGAAHVVGVDPRAECIDIATRTRRRSNLELRCEPPGAIELEDGSFDCIFVADGARLLRNSGVLEELRRLLVPAGHLVLAAKSADRPDAVGGASYYEVVDRLAPLFAPVRMVAQAPFVAMSLVEYADGAGGEPGIELDTSLAASAEPDTTDYLAICGGSTEDLRGFTIVQLPTDAGVMELAAAAGLMAPPPALSTEDLDAKVATERALRAEEEARRARTVAESLRAALAEAEAQAERDSAQPDDSRQTAKTDRETVSEMVAAALAEHEALVRDLDRALDERSAESEKLEEELSRTRESNRAALEKARARVTALEEEVDTWRTRATAAEGKALKLEADADLRLRSGQSVEEMEKLRAQLAEAEDKLARATDNWHQAEAKNDEVWRKVGELQSELEKGREDQVETAARQRKAAQSQLTRAMEEASKKLVSVKDDLLRAERARDTAELRVADGERERKDLVAKLSAAQARESELARHIAEAEARVQAAQADLASKNGADMAPEVEARLSLVSDRLAGVERALTSERELIEEIETALTGLRDRADESREPDDTGWAGIKEQQLRSFATELGTKDAELALLHVGLSSVRERLREVVAHVREARRAMEGQSAPEMLALMDRLATKLSLYEGMG